MHYIIGDVHGCLDELKALLDRVRPDSGDSIILVGDLIGRGGPDPVATVEYVRSLPSQIDGDVHVLRGDAEDLFLGAIEQISLDEHACEIPWLRGASEPRWALMWFELSGDQEVQAWQALDRDSLTDVFTWLDATPFAWQGNVEGKKVIVSHAGLNPSPPELTHQTAYDLLFSKGWEPQFHHRDEVLGDIPWDRVIYGHNPVVNPGVRYGRLVNVDGGCVFNGYLAAYRIEDDHVFTQHRRKK